MSTSSSWQGSTITAGMYIRNIPFNFFLAETNMEVKTGWFSSNVDPISDGHLSNLGFDEKSQNCQMYFSRSSYPISDGHLSDLGFGEARTITFSSTAPSKLTSPTMEQQYQGSYLKLTKYITHPIANLDTDLIPSSSNNQISSSNF